MTEKNVTKNTEADLIRLAYQVKKTMGAIEELREKMNRLKDQKIPTQEYKKLQKELSGAEKEYSRLLEEKKKVEELGIVLPAGADNYREIKAAEDKVRELKTSLEELEEAGKGFTLGKNTAEYAGYEKELQKQEDAASGADEEKRLDRIRVNATAVNQQIISLLERRRQLTAEITDMEKAGVGFGYQQYDSARAELAQIDAQVNAYSAKFTQVPDQFAEMCRAAKTAFTVIRAGLSLINTGSKAFPALADGGKKAGNMLTAFSAKLKNMAGSISVFRWISSGFGLMVSGMKKGLSIAAAGIIKGFEFMVTGIRKSFGLLAAGMKKGLDIMVSSAKKGFENLLGYSDSYAQGIQGLKDALSVLGNQFAAAFAPIVQAVIPWLMSLINVISAAATYVAQFIAAIGGRSTFIKAKQVQDAYNKSLGGTRNAAEKAYGALSRFDDLEVLQAASAADTAGTDGGEQTGMSEMFEEVPVDPSVIGWLSSVFASVAEIKDALKDGFFDGLGDVGGRFGSIKDSILSVKDSLIEIWSDSAVRSAADGWVQSAAYALGSLAGSAASIGITIASNLLGGVELYLNENGGRIKEYLISMFRIGEDINDLLSEAFGSIAYVFEAFASENGQQLTANLIGLFSNAFMGVTELAGALARDILNVIIQPFTENEEAFRTALEGFLGVLAEVTGTIKQSIDDTFGKIQEVYEEHLKPFFDSIAEGLSDTVGKFMEFWNGSVQPLLDEWAAKFDVIWKEHIQPALDKFAELMGKVAELLRALWENHLKPLIDWIIENILPVVLPIVDGIANAVMIGFGVVGDVIGGIIDVIGGIIDFLTGVFSTDWRKVWDNIVDVFMEIFKRIPAFIESKFNIAIAFINDIINGINSITGKVGIPEMPNIPYLQLPRLANGAVIRGGNPFMAILGDQPQGQTNIEAPLATIEQAVENAMSRRGYGGGLNPTISLNVDGQAFARLTLGDILQEMGRQGYNVNILGVN